MNNDLNSMTRFIKYYDNFYKRLKRNPNLNLFNFILEEIEESDFANPAILILTELMSFDKLLFRLYMTKTKNKYVLVNMTDKFVKKIKEINLVKFLIKNYKNLSESYCNLKNNLMPETGKTLEQLELEGKYEGKYNKIYFQYKSKFGENFIDLLHSLFISEKNSSDKANKNLDELFVKYKFLNLDVIALVDYYKNFLSRDKDKEILVHILEEKNEKSNALKIIKFIHEHPLN